MELEQIQSMYDFVCCHYGLGRVRVEWEPNIRATHNGIYYPRIGVIRLKRDVLIHSDPDYAMYIVLHEITHHVWPGELCGSFGEEYRDAFDEKVSDIRGLLSTYCI